MNRFALIALIVVLAAAAGYALFLRPEPAPTPSSETVNQNVNQEPNQTLPESTAPAVTESKTHVVEFTEAGFAPKALTIKAGDSVQFVNKTSGLFWPASAPHPAHTDFPEFDPKGGIGANGTYSVTFKEPKTYRYHNHLKPADFGSITVE